MTTGDPASGFGPPAGSLEQGPQQPRQPPTVGYLIGAILQLVLGTFWAYRGLAAGRFFILTMGSLLLVLGVRAVRKYRRARRMAAAYDEARRR